MNETLHALKTYGISREETETDLETLLKRMKGILCSKKESTMSQLHKIIGNGTSYNAMDQVSLLNYCPSHECILY